jgi:hypothetical protein
MAISYNETLRNNRLDEVSALAGSSALLRIYSGTRPATGAAPGGTLLAELTCGSPFAPAASGGVLTANSITTNQAAASGTASWFRVVASNGTTHVVDGDVGTSGSDLNLSSTSIVEGGDVSVTSLTITHANA